MAKGEALLSSATGAVDFNDDKPSANAVSFDSDDEGSDSESPSTTSSSSAAAAADGDDSDDEMKPTQFKGSGKHEFSLKTTKSMTNKLKKAGKKLVRSKGLSDSERGAIADECLTEISGDFMGLCVFERPAAILARALIPSLSSNGALKLFNLLDSASNKRILYLAKHEYGRLVIKAVMRVCRFSFLLDADASDVEEEVEADDAMDGSSSSSDGEADHSQTGPTIALRTSWNGRKYTVPSKDPWVTAVREGAHSLLSNMVDIVPSLFDSNWGSYCLGAIIRVIRGVSVALPRENKVRSAFLQKLERNPEVHDAIPPRATHRLIETLGFKVVEIFEAADTASRNNFLYSSSISMSLLHIIPAITERAFNADLEDPNSKVHKRSLSIFRQISRALFGFKIEKTKFEFAEAMTSAQKAHVKTIISTPSGQEIFETLIASFGAGGLSIFEAAVLQDKKAIADFAWSSASRPLLVSVLQAASRRYQDLVGHIAAALTNEVPSLLKKGHTGIVGALAEAVMVSRKGGLSFTRSIARSVGFPKYVHGFASSKAEASNPGAAFALLTGRFKNKTVKYNAEKTSSADELVASLSTVGAVCLGAILLTKASVGGPFQFGFADLGPVALCALAQVWSPEGKGTTLCCPISSMLESPNRDAVVATIKVIAPQIGTPALNVFSSLRVSTLIGLMFRETESVDDRVVITQRLLVSKSKDGGCGANELRRFAFSSDLPRILRMDHFTTNQPTWELKQEAFVGRDRSDRKKAYFAGDFKLPYDSTLKVVKKKSPKKEVVAPVAVVATAPSKDGAEPSAKRIPNPKDAERSARDIKKAAKAEKTAEILAKRREKKKAARDEANAAREVAAAKKKAAKTIKQLKHQEKVAEDGRIKAEGLARLKAYNIAANDARKNRAVEIKAELAEAEKKSPECFAAAKVKIAIEHQAMEIAIAEKKLRPLTEKETWDIRRSICKGEPVKEVKIPQLFTHPERSAVWKSAYDAPTNPELLATRTAARKAVKENKNEVTIAALEKANAEYRVHQESTMAARKLKADKAILSAGRKILCAANEKIDAVREAKQTAWEKKHGVSPKDNPKRVPSKAAMAAKAAAASVKKNVKVAKATPKDVEKTSVAVVAKSTTKSTKKAAKVLASAEKMVAKTEAKKKAPVKETPVAKTSKKKAPKKKAPKVVAEKEIPVKAAGAKKAAKKAPKATVKVTKAPKAKVVAEEAMAVEVTKATLTPKKAGKASKKAIKALASAEKMVAKNEAPVAVNKEAVNVAADKASAAERKAAKKKAIAAKVALNKAKIVARKAAKAAQIAKLKQKEAKKSPEEEVVAEEKSEAPVAAPVAEKVEKKKTKVKKRKGLSALASAPLVPATPTKAVSKASQARKAASHIKAKKVTASGKSAATGRAARLASKKKSSK